MNGIDDRDIVVEHLEDGQNPNINNDEVENSTQDQSNMQEMTRKYKKKKPMPMNPTPLYESLFY